MKKCAECVYYLPHGETYNCGYFVKTVKENDGCCKYFKGGSSAEKPDNELTVGRYRHPLHFIPHP